MRGSLGDHRLSSPASSPDECRECRLENENDADSTESSSTSESTRSSASSSTSRVDRCSLNHACTACCTLTVSWSRAALSSLLLLAPVARRARSSKRLVRALVVEYAYESSSSRGVVGRRTSAGAPGALHSTAPSTTSCALWQARKPLVNRASDADCKVAAAVVGLLEGLLDELELAGQQLGLAARSAATHLAHPLRPGHVSTIVLQPERPPPAYSMQNERDRQSTALNRRAGGPPPSAAASVC
eukprot:scaffold103675_cov70-Phaeocystis_antarctica.AAC.4